MIHATFQGLAARTLRLLAQVLLLLPVLLAADAANAALCHVATSGTGNGSHWASAASLQGALADTGCTEIWIQQGTYKPTAGADRTISFAIDRPLKLYGGFAGTETALAQRSGDSSLTVLSGDIGVAGDNTDNSHHVVVIGGLGADGNGAYTSSNTAIDGLTISGGYGNDDANPFVEYSGGGLYCNGWGAGRQCGPGISNVVFRGNFAKTRGGAIYLTGAGSFAISKSAFLSNSSRLGGAIRVAGNASNATAIVQSTFTANAASGNGGALYLSDDGFTVAQSTFTENTAQWGSAAVVANAGNLSGRIQQSTFSGNVASDRAVVHVLGVGPIAISQSTFSGNGSTWQGSAIYIQGGSNHSVASSIFDRIDGSAQPQIFIATGSTVTVTHSIVEGGCPTRVNCTATTDADPGLQALADNGGPTQTMLPGAGSPAIDVAGACTAQTTDQRGLGRNVHGDCDLGAVELQPPSAPTAVTATAGSAQATVAWTAPASDGAITRYTVAAVEDGTRTCTVSTGSPVASTCTVTGLASGTAYTFTVVASSAHGAGPASAASTAVTPTAVVVVDPPPTNPTVPVTGPGTTTITDPTLPVVVGPGAGGGTIVIPGAGTTPVTLQVTINGQPLQVQALPGTQLRVAQVNGQSVLVLVVLQGWAQMSSSSAGQPMVLAGPVLLSSGHVNTTVEAQPLAVAVQVGSLVPPAGALPALGSMGLQAGERLQVDASGAVVSATLGSLAGRSPLPGDMLSFAGLPLALTVDNTAFARLAGPVARLSGLDLARGLEAAPSGVLLVRDGAQVFQLLPMRPITIDARQPDGVGFTPMGLLRWVKGGVVVEFAPAVADLAGLAQAVTALLPDAQLKLGAEGVLQLRTGGSVYVLRPDWAGGGAGAGTPQVGVDGQGRIYFQSGQGPRQLLLPSLVSNQEASAIVRQALPGAVLAVQPGSDDGAMGLVLQGQQWRLVPQWVLPAGHAAQVPPLAGAWWMGADGFLYLRLGGLVQGVRVVD